MIWNMENATKKTNGGIIGVLLRGAGQVMFQNNAWTGLFFLAGIFYGAVSGGTPLVAWGALLGLVVSTMTGYL
ncbi:MAG: urea transporter, partial [Tidjanibacter sp.]|nr:urea transporter [Tidjanibacter sp.]